MQTSLKLIPLNGNCLTYKRKREQGSRKIISLDICLLLL